ncbi:MAG: DUF5683 domain-containing protein [Ignavibacteria bacterium]|nr:DUF5683 domain-containing protein [Ignavibacteria bacterium]
MIIPKKLLLLFLFFAFTLNLFSQDLDTTPNNKQNQILPKDTNYRFFASKKSPLGAVVRSLILPGWGQIYVEQYWKAPLFLAGAGVMYYYVFKHNKDFRNYSQQYNEISQSNPKDPRLFSLKIRRENSRDNRDISIFFLVGVYGLSMLDAYVNAHLFSFNLDENFSLSFLPDGKGMKLSISIFY